MRLFNLACLFLCTLGVTVAQTPPKAQPLLRFRAVSCLGANPTELYYKSKDNNYALITAFPDRRSLFCDLYYPTEEIVFYKKSTDPVTKKDAYTAVGSVNISGKGHIPLLLFLPDTTTPLGLRVLALNDDAESVPAGTFRFLNLTTQPLIVSVNKSPYTIAPAADILLPALAENGDATVAIGVNYQGKTRLLFTDIWGTSTRTRTLVLLYISPGNDGGFTVGRIIDYPNGWKPEPPKTPPAKGT